MECGDIFFASQTRRDMETVGTLTQHIYLFLKFLKENEEETNYIASEQP